jgi:hypothetical protein
VTIGERPSDFLAQQHKEQQQHPHLVDLLKLTINNGEPSEYLVPHSILLKILDEIQRYKK